MENKLLDKDLLEFFYNLLENDKEKLIIKNILEKSSNKEILENLISFSKNKPNA